MYFFFFFILFKVVEKRRTEAQREHSPVVTAFVRASAACHQTTTTKESCCCEGNRSRNLFIGNYALFGVTLVGGVEMLWQQLWEKREEDEEKRFRAFSSSARGGIVV